MLVVAIQQHLQSRPLVVQVQLQLVTATVKLFLKKPTERPQQMIQLVLTYATQETDNPDLRDRAYVYWSVPYLVPHPPTLQHAPCQMRWGPGSTHTDLSMCGHRPDRSYDVALEARCPLSSCRVLFCLPFCSQGGARKVTPLSCPARMRWYGCAGGCCPQTQRLQRRWCWLRSLSLQTLAAIWSLHCWMCCWQTCPPSHLCTTNLPRYTSTQFYTFYFTMKHFL